MPNGDITFELMPEMLLLKDIGHQPHAPLFSEFFSIPGNNPGALLTAMLQCIQTKIGHSGCFRVSVYAE